MSQTLTNRHLLCRRPLQARARSLVAVFHRRLTQVLVLAVIHPALVMFPQMNPHIVEEEAGADVREGTKIENRQVDRIRRTAAAASPLHQMNAEDRDDLRRAPVLVQGGGALGGVNRVEGKEALVQYLLIHLVGLRRTHVRGRGRSREEM